MKPQDLEACRPALLQVLAVLLPGSVSLAHELLRLLHRAFCELHLLPGTDSILMNFDLSLAVFQIILPADGLPGKLALLTDGNRALTETISQRRREEEAEGCVSCGGL